MPERSFRVIIKNSSSFLSLDQTFNHLCSGVYTDGWLPPTHIGAGESGGLQSESDNFMGGTEAYIKFDVNAPNGKQGMVYIYWYNPFWGNTSWNVLTASNDVPPQCDYSIPEGEATFGNSNDKLDFTANWQLLRPGTQPEGPGDAIVLSGVGSYLGPAVIPAGLAEVFGTTGIYPNAELDVQVVDAVNAPPLFGQSLGPVSLALLTQARRQDWLGEWSTENGNVSVNIQQSTTGSLLTATVFDATTQPELNFTEQFTPGPTGLLNGAKSVVSALVNQQAQDPAQRATFSRAARTVIELGAKSSLQSRSASNHFQALVGKDKTTIPRAVSQATAGVVGRALGSLIQNQGGAAYLSNHVALMLYGSFENGQQIGVQLQLERLDLNGKPITTVMLKQGAIVK